jgi:hypothetical protein
VGEHRGEQALAGDQPLAGAEQLAHEAAALIGAGREPSPNTVVMLTDGILPHHRAGLGDGAFAGVELDFQELQSSPLISKSMSSLRWPAPAAGGGTGAIMALGADSALSSVQAESGIHSAKPWRQTWPFGFFVACATAAA